VLINYLNNFYIAYLGNIFIYSKDAKSYKQHVNIVLEQLRAAKLQVNIKKSKFHVTCTKYLGYILTNKGIKVDSNKVEALRN
jgi:hypothetical protein